VVFCSRFCRDAAVNSYHSVECNLIRLILVDSGLNENALIAFRLITSTGMKALREAEDAGHLVKADPTWATAKDYKGKFGCRIT